MRFFNNLSVAKKLVIVFSSLIVVGFFVGVFSLMQIKTINTRTQALATSWLPSVEAAQELYADLNFRRVQEFAVLATISNADENVKIAKDLEEVRVRIKENNDSYTKLISGDAERDIYNKYMEQYAEYDKAMLAIESELKKGSYDAAEQATVDVTRTYYQKVQNTLNDLVEFNHTGGNEAAAEAEKTYGATVVFVVGGVVAALVFVGMMGLVLYRGLSLPLSGLERAMRTLAGHDVSVDIPARERKDEVGAMARAVEVFKENMIEADRLTAAQEEERRIKERRSEKLAQLTRDFDGNASAVIDAVGAAARRMQATSTMMSGAAEETSAQATAVATAAEEAAGNIQTVASAAEELSSSIQEIQRRVAQSAEVSNAAVRQAEETSKIVSGLEASANKIGEVVSLINDIAGQTNLLALNATIEAARAGETGRGFAVVANEVKDLASQTARATGDISRQVSGVQDATGLAVQAIGSITGTIDNINEISSSIAAAMEQQGAATREIARNAEQAAGGTNEVTGNIHGVTQAAHDTGLAAREVLSASSQMAEESERLRQVVDAFLNDVRNT